MTESTTWKSMLGERISPVLTEEIDVFERQIALAKTGKIEEKIFAETRLRRGVYGQRYDNGNRYDGEKTQVLPYPSGDIKKGPDTVWDAPGMMRIKIPFGGLNAEQLEALADVAEEYSDAILHITTRQDIQLHFVHIEDTPDLMRRLAAVGITTREACGNTVRNVTACPLSGICRDESFDVTPYSHACAEFLLGHKDTQDFGRKFKVAFSGCKEHACGLASMHDLGAVAHVRKNDSGEEIRGFELWIGGGLGAVPYQAKLYDEFVTEEDLFPISQALARIFARLGEKKNRARARFKFLVDKLGIEELRRMVEEERKIMPHEDAWTDWIPKARAYSEGALRDPSELDAAAQSEDFRKWYSTNVYAQRQKGFAAVTITCPLGDFTSRQTRALADMARKYCKETVRTTVEQNLLFRWISEEDIPSFYEDLSRIGLNEPGAQSIVDITACPGTDTCKLGIASSRGLAAELRTRLKSRELQYDESIKDMRIKISGCFNSCAQHHIAELGFYGTNRKISGYAVPHFQVILGGHFKENANAYGLAIGNVPSKSVPQVVDRYIERYLGERESGETFRDFVQRLGKKESKAMVQDLCTVPAYEEDKSYYVDWADAREFTIGDMGKGECAGEVVSLTDFDLSAAEREVFDAQVVLDEEKDAQKAVDLAYKAMLTAARGLVKIHNIDVSPNAAEAIAEFKKRFVDEGTFRSNFANYFFLLHESDRAGITLEQAHQRVEEAQLFIEAAHECHNKIIALGSSAHGGVSLTQPARR